MICGGLNTIGKKKTSSINHPLISIVTVVFNGEKTLEQTILSVINQTYDNVEYIIIDGNSSDNTLNIIKQYENKIAYWQSEPDKGIYDAMNKGLTYANGDYLLFLGADDLLYNENVIKDIFKYFTKDCVYYGNAIFTRKYNIYNYRFTKTKLFFRNICHQSIFYPKSIFKTNSFNTMFKIYADWDYNMRSWEIKKFKYLPYIISIFNDLSTSQSRDAVFDEQRVKSIQEKYGKLGLSFYGLMRFFARYFYFVQSTLSKIFNPIKNL